jgi:hypothetical protein
MTNPERIKSIYGMRYKYTKDYNLYLMAVQHCNHMINKNTPNHFNWHSLSQVYKPDLTATEIEYFLIKHLDDSSAYRILKKEKQNKRWTEPTLTPSVIEAYPDFKIGSPIPLIQPLPPQRKILINHNIQEILFND